MEMKNICICILLKVCAPGLFVDSCNVYVLFLFIDKQVSPESGKYAIHFDEQKGVTQLIINNPGKEVAFMLLHHFNYSPGNSESRL